MGPESPRLRRCEKRHVKHVGLYAVSMSFGVHKRVSVDDGSRDHRAYTAACLFGIARSVVEGTGYPPHFENAELPLVVRWDIRTILFCAARGTEPGILICSILLSWLILSKRALP
jgi:hypothetical protein